MKRNTLLHFILGKADPETTRQFRQIFAQQILATPPDNDPNYEWGETQEGKQFVKPATPKDPKDSEADQKMIDQNEEDVRKLEKQVKKSTQRDESIDREDRLNKFFQYLFGKEKKSALSIDPQELKRILQVERDPRNRTKYQIQLTDENLLAPKSDQVIQKAIQDLMEKGSVLFDSTQDVMYDPETKELLFQGPKDIGQKFLEELGVRPEIQKEIEKRSAQPQLDPHSQHKFSIPLEDLKIGFSPGDQAEFEDRLRDWLKRKGLHYGKDGTAMVSDDKKKFWFTGTADRLENFINELYLNRVEKDEVFNNLPSYVVEKK